MHNPEDLESHRAGAETYTFPENFIMPEWLKGAEGFLTPEEFEDIGRKTEKIARDARSKRERFSVLFDEHEEWEYEFGPDSQNLG